MALNIMTLANNKHTQQNYSKEECIVSSDRSESIKGMFNSIAHSYDLTNSVLSFGIHHYWRKALFSLLPKGKQFRCALDLCTGTGDVIIELSKFVQGKLYGLDFSAEMLELGREKIAKRGISAEMVQGDVLNLPYDDGVFDLVTISFGIRNVTNLELGLAEIIRVLQPEGVLLVLEFGQPRGIFWKSAFGLYSKVIMPIVGGLISGNFTAYRYLPETSKVFPCGSKFVAKLLEAGFDKTRWTSLTGGIAYAYSAIKRP